MKQVRQVSIHYRIAIGIRYHWILWICSRQITQTPARIFRFLVYFIVLSAVDCVTLPDIILAGPFKQATCTKYTTALSSWSTSLTDEFLYKAKVSDTQRDLPLGRNIVTCVFLRLLSFLPTAGCHSTHREVLGMSSTLTESVGSSSVSDILVLHGRIR